jgi:adenylate kinase family enzyme
MKRIAIFGSPGSGKSTLARNLSAKIGIPVIHIDTLYFSPGWQIKPDDEFRAALSAVVAMDGWITDGNFTTESVASGRIDRADTLIMLHAPRTVCLWRVIWRSIRYHRRIRPDMAVGCPERFDWEFLKYVWNYPIKAERMRKLLTSFQDQKAVYFLNNSGEISRFLANTHLGSTQLRSSY